MLRKYHIFCILKALKAIGISQFKKHAYILLIGEAISKKYLLIPNRTQILFYFCVHLKCVLLASIDYILSACGETFIIN